MNEGNQNFAALVEATCQRHASRPALFFDDRSLSYGELAALAEGWAARLRAAGVAPGDCVATWLPNCPTFVAVFLASLRTGAIAAPLGALLTAREVRARLTVARAGVLVTTPALAAQLGDVSAKVIAVDPRAPSLEVAERRPPWRVTPPIWRCWSRHRAPPATRRRPS